MPFYLHHGNDLKLLKKETDFFEKELIKNNPGLEIINLSDNTTLSIVLEKITSDSLFSSKQLIKIYDIDKINWIEKLLDYETENEVLMTSYKETSPIKNKKKVSIKTFNLPRNYELEKIIPSEFKNQITPEAVDYLSKNISSILDLEELKIMMNEHNIATLTLDNIYKIKGDTEAKIFLIIDDIVNLKLSAIPEIHEFLESGGYIGQIINLLSSQFEKLYQIKKMQENKTSDKDISEKLKITPFIFSKLKKTLQSYSLKKLEALLILLPKMDYQIRFYDKSFTSYFLEKFIIEITEK